MRKVQWGRAPTTLHLVWEENPAKDRKGSWESDWSIPQPCFCWFYPFWTFYIIDYRHEKMTKSRRSAVWTYLRWGDCFWDPGPEEAGMGPGWKAWLGEVVAERALWGEPWADCDGEAEAERCPPGNTRCVLPQCVDHRSALHWGLNSPRLGWVVWTWRDTEREGERLRFWKRNVKKSTESSGVWCIAILTVVH